MVGDGSDTEQWAVVGCLDWATALGVDATVEDQEEAVSGTPVVDLLDPEAWGMSLTDRKAKVAVVSPEGTSTRTARRRWVP